MILLFILTAGCKKENEFEKEIFIRLHNHTLNRIDSVQLFSWGTSIDPVVFYEIDSLTITEFQREDHVFYKNSLVVFLKDTSINEYWEMPYNGTATQPAEEYWPFGYYTIGIYQLDSTLGSVSIALDGYEKSFYELYK